MGNPPNTISELEFESLPPALRRKYFSSLERLRLATEGCTPSSVSPNTRPRTSHRQSIVHTRQKSLFDPSKLAAHRHSIKSRLQKRKSTTKLTPVNADTAAWFASLPPAVRRKQFSKEEQILFANERHSVILDAADELLGRRCDLISPLEPPLPELRPQTSYFPQFEDQRSFYFDSDEEEEEEEDYQDRAKLIDDEKMTDFSLKSFRFLDDEPELDLRLDDYHNAIAETATRQTATPNRRAFRRNLSLSTMSLRRSSISSQTQNASSRSNTSSMFFKPPPTPALPPSPHQLKPSRSSIDPRATFYQDPTARMKLRVYLANASKFDEALEFGFPSLQDKPHVADSRPRTSPRTTNDSRRTYLTDDTPSLSNDDGDSNDELEILHDPRTPEDAEFKHARRSPKMSNDHHSMRPQAFRGITEPYRQSTTLDREMTIHMTLTRPDLRSPGETDPQTNINAVPIVQAELPPSENVASIWDTLPMEESKMKKMWKKLKLR